MKNTIVFCIMTLCISVFLLCSGCRDAYTAKEQQINIREYSCSIPQIALDKNEMILDVNEEESQLRFTIGITSDELKRKEISDSIPYITEYRYYDYQFNEIKNKRKETIAQYEIASANDKSGTLVLGGTQYRPYNMNEGVQYYLYQDDVQLEQIVIPLDWADGNGELSHLYGAKAHLMLADNTIYAGIDYYKGDRCYIYINDRFVAEPDWKPGVPEYELCGLIGIGGTPYALVRVWETDRDGQIVNTLWETARLVPLTPETTELSLEGTDIDGIPTGGAFSDGTYGYFMCGGELWCTDGVESKCIADLTFCGVNQTSEVRCVRTLSDGRILVVADGGLIELTGMTEDNTDERQVFNIGVAKLYGTIDDFSKSVAKYNRNSEKYAFAIKEYSDSSDLNLALLSGEISMIVSRDQLLLKNYINQGFLASLEEVAPDLFKEDVLIKNIVDAPRVDGVCYYLPRTFDIRGEMAHFDLLPNGSKFETLEEYFAFIRENDLTHFKIRTPRDIFTSYAQNLDEWIDWENKIARFDTGTFEALLEFCTNGGSTDEIATYTSQPFNMYVSQFSLEDTINALYCPDILIKYWGDPSSWNEDQESLRTCYSIPSAVFSGYEIYTPHFIGVVKGEEFHEAARDLMEFYFLEDVVTEYERGDIAFDREGYKHTFSINKAECERYLKRNVYDENGNPDALSLELYNRTWDYIYECDHFQYFRNDIFDVMYEEAGRYFAGSITAKQAAEYTQNRISIYLAEQG